MKRLERHIYKVWVIADIGLIASGAVYWWYGWGPGAAEAGTGAEGFVQPLDPQQVQQGQAIYQENCAQCHGANAEGQPDWRQSNPDGTLRPPPHDSTGHTWHHSDGLLYQIIRDGGQIYADTGFESRMPAFGDRLSPAEIRTVIAYLKSLWGSDEREFQAQVSQGDPFP